MSDPTSASGAGPFESPPPPNTPARPRGASGPVLDGFDPPPAGVWPDAPPAERAVDAAATAAFGAFAAASPLLDDLVGMKREIERQLGERVGNRSAARSAGDVRTFAVAPVGLDNVVGVGVGVARADRRGGIAGQLGDGPGAPALLLYVVEPGDPELVRASVAQGMGVRALAADTAPVAVVVTGVIDARPHRLALSPSPGGCSIGHVNVTAGTLGALARGRTEPRRSRLFVVSNNHVLANANDAAQNDPIVQPGPYDGGQFPAGHIANLESWVRLDFAGASNAVDAACAWALPDRVRGDFLYLQNGVPQYFRVGATPGRAAVNLLVGKSGRTTQVTRGEVTSVTATVTVDYGRGRLAVFRDQIEVRDLGSQPFSAGGDSGALIWTHDEQRTPVGLLFAGGGQSTFANHIGPVLDALDLELVT